MLNRTRFLQLAETGEVLVNRAQLHQRGRLSLVLLHTRGTYQLSREVCQHTALPRHLLGFEGLRKELFTSLFVGLG